MQRKGLKLKSSRNFLKRNKENAQTFDYEYLKTREIELLLLTEVPNTGLFEKVLGNLQKDARVKFKVLG